MKKYLLILLLVSTFGNAQYNLFARQNFAKSASVPTFNTEIGGVSATISSASALATKLGISVGAISNFTIVGSDIKCKITGSYGIPSSAFYTTASTYYRDIDYLVSSIGDLGFYATQAFVGYDADFENCTSVGTQAFSPGNSGGGANKILLKNTTSIGNSCFGGSNKTDVIYIPSCTSLGSTSGNDNVFFNNDAPLKSGIKIYVHPSLATNNAGAPDGDLAWVITNRQADVRYVTNFTAPSAITTLAAGTVYNTAIQLNFTPPSSTNAIEYYECYADGVFKSRIYASGEYIAGLVASTNYNITVVAVDVFYNKSVVSNTVNQSTNTTSALPTTGLISYYKRDSDSNDSVNGNNGADTSLSYVAGKINNAGSYNGTTSKTSIGNPANLQLSTVSLSCWIKSSGAGSGYRSIISKRYAYNVYFKDNVLVTYSYGSPVGEKNTGLNIGNGTWKHIVLVQQSGVTNGTKIYINGDLVLTTTVGQTAQTDSVFFGHDTDASGYTNFILDETSIYNTALTQGEIQLIYNNGTGLTY